MQINVYSIEKKEDFQEEIKDFIKKAKQFADIKNYTLYNSKLSKSQNPKLSLKLEKFFLLSKFSSKILIFQLKLFCHLDLKQY